MRAFNFRCKYYFLISVFLLGYALPVYSWNNTTIDYTGHKQITVKAIEYLRDKKFLSGNLVSKILPLLMHGAEFEDKPQYRAWFHYSPELNTVHDKAYCDSIEWGFDGKNCEAFSKTLFGFSAFKEYVILDNNFTWDIAVNKAYSDYGWIALGHVLHLLEDLAVPAHTRNDPHPPQWDLSVEKYAEENIKYEDIPSPALSENLICFDSLDDIEDTKKIFKNLAP